MNWMNALSSGWRKPLPMLLQTEAAECGLACLGMVLGAHGVDTDIASLRQKHPISLKGMSLTHLTEIAEREKLGHRAVRLEIEELAALKLPAILHWELNHFVVLKAVKGKQIIIHDPGFGERRLNFSEASNSFTGVALELWPNPGFVAREEKQRVSVTQLIGQVKGFWPALSQVLLLSLALEVFMLISPLFMQWVVDQVVITRDSDLLTTLGIGFLILLALQQFVSLLRSWVLLGINTSIRVQWHSNVMGHLLRLPLGYFSKRHLGDVVSRSSAIDDIQRAMTSALFETLLDGLLVVLTLIMMFLYSAELAWLSIAAVGVYLIIRLAWFSPQFRATEERIVRSANLASHTLETIRGVRAIKLFGRQTQRHAAWQTLLVSETNATLKIQRLDIAYRIVRSSLSSIFDIALLWWGAKLVMAGQLSVGMLLAFVAYRGQFDLRINDFINKMIDLKMLRLYAERLADIVLTEQEKTGTTLGKNAQLIQGDVHVRQLSFRYADQEPWILRDFDLRIAQGSSVAIVGESGCGKTTLVNLLLGVLKPQEGAIDISGRSIEQVGLEFWRSQVGTVMQDDSLFAGSIADNICFFDARPDMDRIQECARLAAIASDIEDMPMGFQTLVGDMGTVLSGGQKQRVLLARALYKQPRLLILDEATSHLDLARESQVNASISSLSITRIVVAHRPETIASTDRVVALSKGQIVFDGLPHDYVQSLKSA